MDVPMTVTEVSSDGSKRFSVPIQIGDSLPVEALLDTGSSGLVILEGVVPDSAFASVTTTPVVYDYGGGLQLTGVFAYGVVTIGELATPDPIPIVLVTEIGCTSASPDCSGSGQTPADATLFGPYRAILGAGMRNDGTFGNPIVQLPGHPSFVVQAPAYGGDVGTLRIGPTAQELSTFTTYPLPTTDGGLLANGTPSWNDDNGLPGCVHDVTSGMDYCEPVFLDCGACPTYIYWPSAVNDSVFAPGSRLQMTVGPGGAPLGQYAFTVGPVPVPGIDEVELTPSTAGHINVGTAVYFRYDVLWDQTDGLIGLAPH